MLAAMAVFSAMDGGSKGLTLRLSPVEVTWARYLFSLLFLLPLALARGGLRLLTTQMPLAQIGRGALLFGSGLLFITALRTLPLADATAVGFVAPLMVTALSIPLLGERVGLGRWLAVSAGFAGVLAMVGTDAWSGDGWSLGAGFALAGTILYALVMVFMRVLGRTESPVTTVFWFSIQTLILTGLALPLVWHSPDTRAWALFAAAGILGGTGQLLITQAVRLAPASVVAPFDYVHILASSTLGWLIFAEPLALSTLLGAAIVVGAGLYVLKQER